MPNGININGQLIVVPGPAAEINYDANTGAAAPFQNLAIVGDYPFLPKGLPTEVSSQLSLQRLDPGNLELLRQSGIIYGASADDRVQGGPSSVVVVNARENTQAFLYLLDGDSAQSILLQATTWGPKGNQTYVTVDIDDDDGTYTVDIARQGMPSESWGPVQAIDLFTLQYLSSDFADVYSGVKPKTTIAAGSNGVNVGATTTLTAASIGVSLPQATINVDDTTGFPTAGTVVLPTTTGNVSVTYTGKTGTTFTGASGGTGTTSAGVVALSVFTVVAANTEAFAGAGSLLVATDVGNVTVTYESRTGTTFTGCSVEEGVAGTMSTGGIITPASLSEFYVNVTGSEPIGTQAYGIAWNGKVGFFASAQPASGQTYTATVTGKDMAGAAQVGVVSFGDTDVIGTYRWTADLFSYITSIAFTESGSTTPTFTVKGDIVRADTSVYTSVAALADGLIAIADFAVTAVSDFAASLSVADIDPTPRTEISAAAHTFANAKQAVINALAGSALVTATAVEGGGAPVEIAATALTGGSQTSSIGSSDWDDALLGLRRVAASIVWPMSNVNSIHQKVRAHCQYMAGPGRSPRNAWCGAASQETLAQLKTRAFALNTRHVSLVGQDIRRPGPLGNSEWLPPMYLALLCASLQAGTNQAVTFKVPAIDEYRQHASWNPIDDATAAITQMLTIVGEVLIGQATPLTRVIRALTTHLLNNDPARTDVQPNKSINQFLNYAYGALVSMIGQPTTVPIEVIRTTWKGIGQAAVALGIIAGFTDRKATAQYVGNIVVLGCEIRPAYSTDFFPMQVNIQAEGTTGGFSLQLAA